MSEEATVCTEAGEIAVRNHTATTVHRVGFAPTPWQWTDWAYAMDGRFVQLDGIEFASRHGDDLALWAIYERASDTDISARLKLQFDDADLDPKDLELTRAMELLGLRWAD